MKTRPVISARVRLLGNIGWGRFDGHLGTVLAHHQDGIAFFVRVDGSRIAGVLHGGPRGTILLDPVNVQLAAHEEAAT